MARFIGTAPPIIVGPDGANVPGEPDLNGPCAACGTRSAARSFDGALVLCDDVPACCNRYRGGASPDDFAELLAVST